MQPRSLLVILDNVLTATADQAIELLGQVHDVSGVLGALLVSDDGELFAHTFSGLHASSAEDAARRLPVLLEALAAGRSIDSYTLRFPEHRLHVRRLEGGFLGIMTELNCNTALLKMTLNVTGKRVACLLPH